MCKSLDLSLVGWFQNASSGWAGRCNRQHTLFYSKEKSGVLEIVILSGLGVIQMDVSNPCSPAHQQCHSWHKTKSERQFTYQDDRDDKFSLFALLDLLM